MICPYCGGEYADWAQRCPYCDSVNEAGDERVYLEHLQELRNRLDRVDDESEAVYRETIASSTGRLFKTLGLVVLAVICVGTAVLLIRNVVGRHAEHNSLEYSAWEKPEFEKLDAWYDAGEYDKIIEEELKLYEENSKYGLYNWQNYEFVCVDYMYYLLLMDSTNDLSKPPTDDTDIGYGLYNALSLKYVLNDEYLAEQGKIHEQYPEIGLSPEQIDQIRGWQEAADVYLYDMLGLSDEEIREFLDEAMDDDYIKMDLCFDKGKEIAGS